MKIACIALTNNLINIEEQIEIINCIKNKYYEIGETISLISYFDANINDLEKIIFDNFDKIFLIGDDSYYNKTIKEYLSKITNSSLEISQELYSNLNKYCSKNNAIFSLQEEQDVIIPNNAIPICFSDIREVGFIENLDSRVLVFVPNSFVFVKKLIDTDYASLFKNNSNSMYEYQIIKCFGILKKDIYKLIKDVNLDNIDLTITSDNLDVKIKIKYKTDCDNNIIQNTISNIITILNKYIYALEDVSIYDMAIQLLSLQRKKIAISETITYGNIIKNLSLRNKSNIVLSQIFLNENDLLKTYNIDNIVIQENGIFSVNAVYEFANSILEKSLGDIVLFLFGKDDSDVCYIAIGDIDGIHIYKNRINARDNKIIENLSKTAIFYLIKKLKQNNLQFL